MKLLARWCAPIALATPAAFWATKDPATGKPRGVTVDLAAAPPEPRR